MKYILLPFLLVAQLMAAVIEAPITAVAKDHITIAIDQIDRGVSGFVVHHITPNHSTILQEVTVSAFDADAKEAQLTLHPFTALRNNSLPREKRKVAVGDSVVLAFGYSRALLLAPSESLYHEISKRVHVTWVHPDLFATMLSFAGHPTPLYSDFAKFSNSLSAGLLFLYLDQKVFTIDMKSFAILNIADAPFVAKKEQTPFYTRFKSIDAAWWGEGSSRMQSYGPHYYALLAKKNKENQELYTIIKNHKNKEVQALLELFEGEKK